MLVAWRDDGFWTLLWLAAWLLLTGGRKRDLPPRGFVGQISGSLAVIEPRHFKRRLMMLSRTRYTSPAPAWRLTCVWERSRLLSRQILLGPSSEDVGGLPPVADGEDSLGTRRVSSLTTLTLACRASLTSLFYPLVNYPTAGRSWRSSLRGLPGVASRPSSPSHSVASTRDHPVKQLELNLLEQLELPLKSLTLGK